jgi:rhomboid protease GluP
VQIACNLPALLVVGAVAEHVMGRWRMLAAFLLPGLLAQWVSLAAWSPSGGGGDSVAICGLVGALTTTAALTLPFRTTWIALLVPPAGLVLCVLHNNHGVGVVTGCVVGAVSAAVRPGTAPGLTPRSGSRSR